jgi:hypothetical protein
MLDLARRDKNRRLDSQATDLAAVEGVAAGDCLGVNALQIRTDCGPRRDLGAKALELRVISIAASVPAQDSSSQQGLSPQRNEPLRIQVPRVQ